MSELETILKEVLFSEHIKEAKRKAIEAFSEPYNYIVWEPAATYFDKLKINFTDPLVSSNGRSEDEPKSKKRRKRPSPKTVAATDPLDDRVK